MKPDNGSDMLEFLDAIHRKGLLEFSGNHTPDTEIGLLLKRALDSSLIRAGDANGNFGLCFMLTGKGRHALGLSGDRYVNDVSVERCDFDPRRGRNFATFHRLMPAICFIAILCGIALSLFVVRK
ncbi:hypothetical protein [Rhizobium miluonense]|uniref:Uncharacterized protein n=1 Tax=Rhizobium miluonense TaxID=411945 RepID=A0A1C3UYM3_9HYPH|nr:hypothetical protein [Rhizobium miluonense]SCB20582.1 hypothetical protein GA0061102_100711 [Rhizobium miluonense]